ncbi:hypothetical protein SAMN06297144_1802 [Sphingomonas guangdongensis]|uniref:Uncharacterized protein n=1 Tax=Sphingomonas guangdongensis TaxID=1141890 RepID=A0A285QYR8_9SPHN|nr:hypothetical protein SAMN06297144_1802 [Sphingomonas guangdongensis]
MPDGHEPTALLNTPLAAFSELILDFRKHRQADCLLDCVAWLYSFTFCDLDEAHAHVAIVGSEEVVIWTVTARAFKRMGASALLWGQKGYSR